MRHALLPLLALAALGSTPLPESGPRTRVIGSEPPPRPRGAPAHAYRYHGPPSPEQVACPRPGCGAAAGQPCDRRTLGAHSWHKVRVDAAGGAA